MTTVGVKVLKEKDREIDKNTDTQYGTELVTFGLVLRPTSPS